MLNKLLDAIFREKLEDVKQILKAGADINFQGEDARTAYYP